MAIPDLREPGEVIDCTATVGDGESVRAFLQLPSQAGPGLLRMVEPGGVGFGDDTLEEVRLNLLEGHYFASACLPNCYVKAVRVRAPEMTPYPAEIAINSAVVGFDDAEQTYSEISISTHRGVRFLTGKQSSTLDVVTNHARARSGSPFPSACTGCSCSRSPPRMEVELEEALCKASLGRPCPI